MNVAGPRREWTWTALAVASLLGLACSDDATQNAATVGSDGQGGAASGGGQSVGGNSGGTGGTSGVSNGGAGGFSPAGSGGGMTVPQYAEVWYSVADRLVRFPLDPADGSAMPFQQSMITNPPALGQNLLTMMPDGSLIGGRLSNGDNITTFYHIPEPPRDGSPVTLVELGTMIDSIMIEGMYTDCEGRLYGMDTGVDATNAIGNRLLRFTGDFLAGDFTYVVVSDLATADVADIDDMGPGILNNEITDNPGLAIDSGTVHAFDYETGSGTQLGPGGTYGIHALGGSLFDDDVARLYVFSINGELFQMDPVTNAVSASLGAGPQDAQGTLGHSGLAGPLTDCDSGFTPPK